MSEQNQQPLDPDSFARLKQAARILAEAAVRVAEKLREQTDAKKAA